MTLCSFREWQHPPRNGKGKSPPATKRPPLENPSLLLARRREPCRPAAKSPPLGKPSPLLARGAPLRPHTATGQSHRQKFSKARPSVRAIQRRDCCSSANAHRRVSSPIRTNGRSDRDLSKGQSPTTRRSNNGTRRIATPFPHRNV
jgi:hypothetical protein